MTPERPVDIRGGTRAGRDLVERLGWFASEKRDALEEGILAIEAEAAAPAAEPVPLTLDALRPALAEWDAIEGSCLADQFRAFIAAGKMADAIRAALASPDKGEPR